MPSSEISDPPAVVSVIRERILNGQYAPGTRLVERTIASDLGVSRIPVRDALNVLRGEGFVMAFANRGMVVSRLSADDVEELFEVREALEVLAARQAALRATDDEIAGMQRAIANIEEHMSVGPGAVTEQGQDIHALIIAAAHNKLLTSLMEPLEGRTVWLLRQHTDPLPLHREHVGLIGAIAERDADRAAALALEHVQTSRRMWLEADQR